MITEYLTRHEFVNGSFDSFYRNNGNNLSICRESLTTLIDPQAVREGKPITITARKSRPKSMDGWFKLKADQFGRFVVGKHVFNTHHRLQTYLRGHGFGKTFYFQIAVK